jgi:hypothetical protein
MDPASLTTGLSFVRDHAQLFGFFLFAFPLLSFIAIKVWITSREAAKAQSPRQWFVPEDLESESTRIALTNSSRSFAVAPAKRPVSRLPSSTNNNNSHRRSK